MPDKEQETESENSDVPPGNEPDPSESNQTALAAKIFEAEALLTQGSPEAVASLGSKVATLESDLAELKEMTPRPPRLTDLEVAVLAVKGHFQRASGLLDASEATYRAALEILRSDGDNDEAVKTRIANLWTCCGLSALSSNAAEAWTRSVGHFDKAISVRESIPDPTLSDRWGLSASWLNRGDALTRLGGEQNLNGSLEAAQKAADLLLDFDLDENPVFRTRMAIAWMNQGAAYTELTSEYRRNLRENAFESYQTAIETLRPGADLKIPESERILAVALTNLSRARLQLGGHLPEQGVREAREALELINGHESNDPEVAGLGITARISLCRSLEQLQPDDAGDLEITDIAEEGLTVALNIRRNAGNTAVNEAAVGELMRCGAEAYLQHSPHFLTDYLMEFLSPDENELHLADLGACHEVAVQVLWKGIAGLQEKGFQDIGTEAYGKRETLLMSWQQCREDLAEIRSRYFILE